MEPVSSTSAALLQLESQASQMHVGWIARVDAGAGGAPLDVDALRERVAARLGAAPRFRAVVGHAGDRGAGGGERAAGRSGAPGGGGGERAGALVWREDASFAVERHVAVCDAPVAGEDELRGVVDRFLAEGFARERPLWQVLVVPRPRAGGATIVAKAHRALLGEREGNALRDLVFDGVAGAATGARRRDDAVALEEYRAVARMGALTAARRDHGRIGAALRHAAYARTEGLLEPAPPSFLNPGGCRGRTLVTARLELGRLRRIAERSGTNLHDVVLAVAAGALRRMALAAGAEPANLRALVPLDPDGEELLGDAPCAVLELPVAERTPAARLRELHAAMAAARTRATPRPTLLAGPRDELPSRLAIGTRLCNLTIPSAAGPERALAVGGAHVRALFPLAALPDDHALTLGTLSYGRHLHVSAAADTRAVGGVGRLPVMLADAVEELALSTGASASRAPLGQRR